MKTPSDMESFSSHAVRLSIREWLVVLLIVAVVWIALPVIGEKLESFNPDPDFRIPYQSSEDYRLFERFCRTAGRQDKTFIIGDSFVWGQFVPKDQTLSHDLNEQAGIKRYVNLGLDGGHPLALAGLIESYGGGIQNKNVILHLNLIWLCSPEADLQTSKGIRFNHPRLAPQFVPRIPGYQESFSRRIGIVLERHIDLFGWVHHLDIAHFGGLGLPEWSLANPYAPFFERMTAEPSESQKAENPDPRSWKEKGQNKQSLPWVDRKSSWQWQAFKRLIAILEARKNRVFILVGPLNEHMLEAESLSKYKNLLKNIDAWLKDNNHPHLTAPLLPGDLYGDLSHPLGPGYVILARQLEPFL